MKSQIITEEKLTMNIIQPFRRKNSIIVPLDKVFEALKEFEITPEECARLGKEKKAQFKSRWIKGHKNSALSAQGKGDFLHLENLVCQDANGEILEQYDALEVRADVFKEKGEIKRFTPYQAAFYCEQQKLFNPSAALHCAILAKCFQEKGKNAQAKAVLDQYKDYGYGWHSANTLIDAGNAKIVHYPADCDFLRKGGNKSINAAREKKRLPFSRKEYVHLPLEESLKAKAFQRFIQNLTGLQDPSILVKIGKYFQKTAYAWVSSPTAEVMAVQLGCVEDYFYLR